MGEVPAGGHAPQGGGVRQQLVLRHVRRQRPHRLLRLVCTGRRQHHRPGVCVSVCIYVCMSMYLLIATPCLTPETPPSTSTRLYRTRTSQTRCVCVCMYICMYVYVSTYCYAMFDARDPTVYFDSFVQDDDNITDQVCEYPERDIEGGFWSSKMVFCWNWRSMTVFRC